MRTPGWIKEARIPDSDVVFLPRKHPCIITHVPSGFLCLDDRKRDDIKLFKTKKNTALLWNSGHVHPCNCLRFGKQATAPSPPSRKHLQHVQKKSHVHPARSKNKSLLQQCCRLIDRGSDRGEATICSWICGTGTARIRCRAPATFNSFENPLQAASPFPHSSRNQIVCL